MAQEGTKQVLQVLAERDPGILPRILERFCNLNIVPVRFSAVCGSGDEIFVEVDVTGLAPTTLALIVAKLGELPAVLNAVLADAER